MNKKLYQAMNWPEIEAIIYSESDNPHATLGMKKVGNQVVVQTFQPEASSVCVEIENGKKIYTMEEVDEAGYFACMIPEKKCLNYSFTVESKDGKRKRVEDPYQFEPVITQKDTQKFQAGIHYRAYQCLGAHRMTINGIEGVHFAVWAPNAVRVSVVGDFCQWDGRVYQMRRLWDSGIFELFLPEAKEGDNYKFELKLKGGLTYLKADPYGFGGQLRPETASVVRDITDFKWEDEEWIKNREEQELKSLPISVYELYLGSFKKPEDGRDYYTYRELAPMIITYVKEMGYTHIELMPIMEHPLDASWGYQVIGYYAPTARYGTPKDFMYFMNEMHKAGIGVILDWVPAHFPRDVQGLSNFDGTCLYEHIDPRKGSHPHWGTLIYNYARPEVSNYLIANAMYWVEQYHVDGLRMDAVASMLYLDYGKQDGQWVANMYGGNENLDAVEFFRHLNSILKKFGRGVMSIAEESTAWPQITGSVDQGGLGFDFKWNMGWMNDYLAYIKYDPYFRSHHHGELTFSMIYMYSEQFMLVFSHDEVVHGKASLLSKMPGGEKEKWENLKLTIGYMMTHPGKKLLFMGQDIGEADEWSEDRMVHWNLTEEAPSKGLQAWIKALNGFYIKYPALSQLDDSEQGFEWINSISARECVLIFLRKAQNKEDTLLIVCNFANVEYKNYKIGVPFAGKYKELLNSDQTIFGGENRVNPRVKQSSKDECDDRVDSIKVALAPLSVSVFSCTPAQEEESKPDKGGKSEKNVDVVGKKPARTSSRRRV